MQTWTHRLRTTFEIALLAALFVVLALTILAQVNPGTHVIHRDSGFYIYIGDQLLHGKTLYRDAWDHKPPAIYYLNAFALWIGQGSRWGVWFIEFIFLFTAICFSYISLKRIWGTGAALSGVFLWLYGLERTLDGGNLTEEYPLALHFLSLLVFIRLMEKPSERISQFLLGFILSGTFLFRPNIAIVQIMMVCILWIVMWIQKRYREMLPLLLWTGVGAALPILFVAGYFASKGLFQDLVDAVFIYNFAYTQTSLNDSSRLLAGFQIMGISAWIALAGYLAAIVLFKTEAQNRYLYLYLLLTVPVMIYVNDPAKRFYPHYFMGWLPFIALAGASLWHMFQSRVLPNARDSFLYRVSAYLILLVSVTVYLFLSDRAQGYINAYIGHTTDEQWMVEQTSNIANYVRSQTQPGDIVLFWGAYPDKNFLSGRDAPTRALFYPLYVDSTVSRRLNEEFLHDLQTAPPTLIVDMGDPIEVPFLDRQKRQEQLDHGFQLIYTPQNLEQVFEFIEQHYTPIDVVGGKQIYRLNSAQ